MNNVCMVARLTKDPELRFVAGSGKAVASFSIAVDRPFSKDKATDFFNCVAWGQTGESLANHMQKGCMIGIVGRLESRSYEAKDGSKRHVVEIVAEKIDFLSWPDKSKEYNDDAIGGFVAAEDDGYNPVDK